MVSTNTVCFEGICRIYRTSVVGHIRLAFLAKYPDDWLARLKSPFKKEWQAIASNAQLRRQTGELGAQLRDEFDILGVNHFHNVFEKYFEDLFPSVNSMTTNERKQQKQAILGWARSIKNMRDPVVGHPADDDISIRDALLMLDASRRILECIDPSAAERVGKLWNDLRQGELTFMTEDIGNERVVETSTLPSRESIAPRFVGRQSELAKLNEWYNDPYSRVWMLAGDGGKGKTAIAYEFAVAIKNRSPIDLEIVIWLSAKARRFESGRSFEIESPDFWDLDSVLDCVLRAYGAIDFVEQDTQARIEQCVEYLKLLPALVILDDVDSLEGENDDAINFFTERVHGTPSKVLLTSRRIPFGMGSRSTQVTGFETASEEGIKFIDSRIDMYELDPGQFNRSVKSRILKACDGSPLFVQDLLRLCVVGETPNSAIKLWTERQGEPARKYALQREFEMLSDLAKRVLLTCALFPGPVSEPEIEVAATVTKDECHSAIQELQRLFLLPKTRFIEEAPRFDLNTNTRRLVSEVYGRTDLAQRISNLIRVLIWQAKPTPALREQIGQRIRQAVSFVKLNQYTEAESTLLKAIDLYPEAADLHGSLGWVYKSWHPQRRYTDARSRFTRAAELRSSREDTYWHWAQMELGQSEWTSAAEAAERGLATFDSSERLSYLTGLARSRLAKDLYQQAHFGRAKQEALHAEAHLKAALLDMNDLESGQFDFHSQVHRAKVINYEHLVRISQSEQDGRGGAQYIRLLGHSLALWRSEHPDDPNTISESQRLENRFPSLSNAVE